MVLQVLLLTWAQTVPGMLVALVTAGLRGLAAPNDR